MTQVQDPLALLGKASDSPEVQDLLRQAGAETAPNEEGGRSCVVGLKQAGTRPGLC